MTRCSRQPSGVRCRDRTELERQVRRMLADRRASALVTNFAAQWLYQRNLRIAAPDFYHFPDWDDNLRLAMARETELFLESQLRADRPVDELLTANYTFLNDRLARHYGVSGVHGSHFRRVTLSDERRFGLLGHASLLTVTSLPNRTSPVVRGKWLLENMLGYPPPAPPPDVPALTENDRGQKPRSVRERMEEHRKNPACASCHAVMDPIGFSLDEFDAIGRTRATDGGVPVDATGALPDGRTIAGVNGLRALIVGQREQFVRTATEKLLTYAVGRGVEYLRHADRSGDRDETRRRATTPGRRLSSASCRAIRSRCGREKGSHDHYEEGNSPPDSAPRPGRHAGAAAAGLDGPARHRRSSARPRGRSAGSPLPTPETVWLKGFSSRKPPARHTS